MTTTDTVVATAQAPAGHGQGLVKILRRLGWGVADQGVSSLSNFALGLFVARVYGADGFGAFTLAFVTYAVVLNAARGVGTDPLLVRHSGDPNRAWRRASSYATGSALTVGVAGGVICIVAGVLLPADIGTGFWVLGLGLPGLMLQDSFRFVFFACGRGRSAFVNDTIWTVLLVAVLGVLYLTGAGNPAVCLFVFGATATVSGVIGAFQARILPRPTYLPSWLRTHRSLSYRYLTENVSFSLATQLRSFALGALAGLAAVGYVRGSEILMGPFLVLLMGLSQVVVPEAARQFKIGPEQLRSFCRRLGVLQAAAAIAWGAVILLVFPHGLGPALLGELWGPSSRLIPAITMTVCGASFSTAANAGLRAMGISKRSLRAAVLGGILYAGLGTLGAWLGGALGASWGVASAQVLGATFAWYQLRSALADHARATTP